MGLLSDSTVGAKLMTSHFRCTTSWLAVMAKAINCAAVTDTFLDSQNIIHACSARPGAGTRYETL